MKIKTDVFLSVVMSNIEEIEIRNIDHLGIVAGVVDSIDLASICCSY